MTEHINTTPPEPEPEPERIDPTELQRLQTQARELARSHGKPFANIADSHIYQTQVPMDQLPPTVQAFFNSYTPVDVTVVHDEYSGGAAIKLKQSGPHGNGEYVNTAKYDLSTDGLRNASCVLIDKRPDQQIDNVLSQDHDVISPEDGLELQAFMHDLRRLALAAAA
jgi:hypothetical protein